MTLIVLNDVCIRFIFLDCFQICGRLEMISAVEKLQAGIFAVLRSAVYKTLGQYACLSDNPITSGNVTCLTGKNAMRQIVECPEPVARRRVDQSLTAKRSRRNGKSARRINEGISLFDVMR